MVRALVEGENVISPGSSWALEPSDDNDTATHGLRTHKPSDAVADGNVEHVVTPHRAVSQGLNLYSTVDRERR